MNYKKNDGDTNGNVNEQPLFPFMPNREQIRSFKRSIPVSVYDFYITDEIKEPDMYMELIHTLKSADPQDTIFIYLNTPGGNLYTTVQILSAMNSSQAKVITSLEGQACSAGTFIFLKGDTKIVNPNCTFMIHNYSQGASGKGNEIVSHVNYMGRYFRRLAEDIYKDFLSESELGHIIKGDDIWMDSYDLVKRLDAHEHDYVYTGENLDEILDKDGPKVGVDELEMDDVAPIKKRITRKKASKKKVTKKKVSKKSE